MKILDDLRNVMKRENLTTGDVSDGTNISKDAIRRWFKGVQSPSRESIVALAGFIAEHTNFDSHAGFEDHPRANTVRHVSTKQMPAEWK